MGESMGETAGTQVPDTVIGARLPTLAEGAEPPLNEPPPASASEALRELRGSAPACARWCGATSPPSSRLVLRLLLGRCDAIMTVAVYATVFYVMGFSPFGPAVRAPSFALFLSQRFGPLERLQHRVVDRHGPRW